MEGPLTQVSPKTLTRADYERLLDDEMLAFVRETEAFYEGVGPTLAEQRAAYDAMCAHFRRERPTGLWVEDAEIAGVPVRRYGSGEPAILYLHGGGFVLGGLDSHDDICAELAVRLRCKVVSVGYRLAPVSPFPAGFEDGLAVATALAGRPFVLAGDSAGATIAAGISATLEVGCENPLGQVLIYPGLAAVRSGGSWDRHANAPLLTRAECESYLPLYVQGPIPQHDPRFAPLTAERFDGLPATFVSGAEFDPLHDDGARYCERIRAAGGSVEFVSEPGLVHGHLRARHSSKRAGAAFDRIVAAIGGFAGQT